MDPGGWLARHVHSFEEALYVLEGVLIFEIGGRVHRLVPGDFALNPIGVPHGIAATPDQRGPLAVGQHAAAPAARRPRPRHDLHRATRTGHCGARSAAAEPLGPGDPTRRNVGHYDGTPPQARGARA